MATTSRPMPGHVDGAGDRERLRREQYERPPVLLVGSVFKFGDQTKQIATQLATIAAGEPCEARPIERLDDGIRGRNRL